MVRMLLNIRSMADVRAKWHGLKSFMGYFRSKGNEDAAGLPGANS